MPSLLADVAYPDDALPTFVFAVVAGLLFAGGVAWLGLWALRQSRTNSSDRSSS